MTYLSSWHLYVIVLIFVVRSNLSHDLEPVIRHLYMHLWMIA